VFQVVVHRCGRTKWEFSPKLNQKNKGNENLLFLESKLFNLLAFEHSVAFDLQLGF
jgi:hypothetical protein